MNRNKPKPPVQAHIRGKMNIPEEPTLDHRVLFHTQSIVEAGKYVGEDIQIVNMKLEGDENPGCIATAKFEEVSDVIHRAEHDIIHASAPTLSMKSCSVNLSKAVIMRPGGGVQIQCCKCKGLFLGQIGLRSHKSNSNCGVTANLDQSETKEMSEGRCDVCHRLFKGTRGLKQHKQRTECGSAVGASVDSNQKRCLPSGCEPELLTGQDTNHCSSSRYAIDIEIRKLKKIECKQPIQWPQMSA